MGRCGANPARGRRVALRPVTWPAKRRGSSSAAWARHRGAGPVASNTGRMQQEVVVRLATHGDAEAIAALSRDLIEHGLRWS